jgi:hypothetical protein
VKRLLCRPFWKGAPVERSLEGSKSHLSSCRRSIHEWQCVSPPADARHPAKYLEIVVPRSLALMTSMEYSCPPGVESNVRSRSSAVCAATACCIRQPAAQRAIASAAARDGRKICGKQSLTTRLRVVDGDVVGIDAHVKENLENEQRGHDLPRCAVVIEGAMLTKPTRYWSSFILESNRGVHGREVGGVHGRKALS